MNLRSIIIIVIIAIAIISASLYLAFILTREPQEVSQENGGLEGVNNQGSLNGKIEEIKSRITYPNSNNDTTVNISYDFKKIPSDSSLNGLLDSLDQDVNSF